MMINVQLKKTSKIIALVNDYFEQGVKLVIDFLLLLESEKALKAIFKWLKIVKQIDHNRGNNHTHKAM